MMNVFRSHIFCLLIFLTLPLLKGFSQTDTEFWFVATDITEGHGNDPGGSPIYFRVSAMDLDAVVTITQPARDPGFDTTFNVPKNSTVSIDASNWLADIENSPPGILLPEPNNKGILVTSDNLITVYYDENEFYNRDIYALKGKNALGLEFYAPFNHQWRNSDSYTPLPYSSIDIVATDDNTVIKITPTSNLVGGYASGVEFTIILDRGETFSCQPTSQAAANHLGGTYIKSDKPIAVSISDDSVHAEPQGCKDLIGDQLVPMRRYDGTKIVGLEYIVMRGKINLTNIWVDPTIGVASGERMFIMATQPNTNVYIDGAALPTFTLANPGDQADFELLSNGTHVRGDKPIMVLHVAGFGCEFGGAVLPTIDGCTGSLEVSFTRSTAGGSNRFFLNIMTKAAAKGAFTMHYEDGSTFPIPDTWFEDVGTTGFVCLKNTNKEFANGTGGGVPVDEVVKVTNSVGVFHLGLIEGGNNSGCKYGYFSDYAESRGSVVVVETGSSSIFRCFGDTAQLRATGGVSYSWSPSDYLDDPFIATPKAAPPPGVYNYTVTLDRGECFPDTNFTVIVGIAPEVTAFFETDKWYVCAPDTLTLDNLSTGVDMSSTFNTQWDFDLDAPGGYVYDTNATIQHIVTNTSDTVHKKTIQLLVRNTKGCTSDFRRDVIIRPEMTGGFTADVTNGCHPLNVNFTNTSTGNTDRFKWTLGDGNSSNSASPSHTYINFGMADSTYHVQMVAISPFFCYDTVETDISVYPYIEADYAIDTFQGCSPLTLGIDNNSAGYIEEYEWDFGDLSTSDTSDASFTHTYVNETDSPVEYDLQLVVKNNTRGCYDTIIRIISVYPDVTAGFTQVDTAACHGEIISFTNQSAATATFYNWDFGDGGSSTSTSPGHLYENMTAANVDYTVRLISTTPNLCRDTAFQTVTIHPYIHADFSVDEFQGCAPFTVSLNNASDGAISAYEWDWGDGSAPSASGGATQTHEYQNVTPAPITRSLQLVVDNADGCTDTLIRSISVYPEIQAALTQDLTEGCNPLDVQFTNQSNVYATTFTWEFGDGGSSELENPPHQFVNFGSGNTTHTTKLIAKSDHGCIDSATVDITVYSFLNADFTFSQGTVCSPFIVDFTNASVGGTNFQWTFGDGSDSTLANNNSVSHEFNNSTLTVPTDYTVNLQAWNADNYLSQISRDITVFPIVVANFSADITNGCHPLTVQFTNSSSGALTYSWDFGNQQSTDDTNPEMTFENYSLNDSTFNVKLTSTNIHTCQDTFVVPILVSPFVDADFSVTYINQCSPTDVTFENSTVNGQQYDWSFGGTPYSTATMDPITRTFNNSSTTNDVTYTVDLDVTSPQGCNSSTSKQVTVHHLVDAIFTSDTAGCQPLSVDFTNTSQGATDYKWEFGDARSSILENPSNSYTNDAHQNIIYQVKLIAISENLCPDSAFSQITVYPAPKAKFNVDKTVACSPLEINITNTSENGDTYIWDYDDGTDPDSVTNTNPSSYTYQNDAGTTLAIELTLDVFSDNGCSDNIIQNLTVYPSVITDFERDSAGCSPYFSEFTNNSTGTSNYLWSLGDGTASLLVNPSHTFVNNTEINKIFDVTLSGSSGFGCADTITKQITVYPSPVAKFDYTPIYQYFPSATIDLTNETNEGTYNYLWKYDDGTISLQEDPGTYTYTHWGEYDISLFVSNDQCTDSVTHWIKIFPPLPIAGFISDVDSGCVPLNVRFTDESTYAEDYYWSYDDGGSSTQTDPVYTFTEPGIYQVKQTVIGEGGEDIAFREIHAFRLPEVKFTVEPTLIMLPDQYAKIFNFSEYGVTFLWDFGDGTTYTTDEPAHLYTELGTYDVSLEVWTKHGCEGYLIKPLEVEVIGAGVVEYPNVFAPNMTGPTGGKYNPTDVSNQTFFPMHEGVIKYSLMIYNRWGELIFKTTDINTGWDGYYQDGTLAPQGVYIYKVEGTYTNGSLFEHLGDVTVLHKPQN